MSIHFHREKFSFLLDFDRYSVSGKMIRWGERKPEDKTFFLERALARVKKRISEIPTELETILNSDK